MEIAGMPGILIGWGVLAMAFCIYLFAWQRRWKMTPWYEVISTILIVISVLDFNTMGRVIVSIGLGMTAIFYLMELNRTRPKRQRYEL